MTDANATGASVRLYSQIQPDERGNLHYQGDLFRSGERLPELAARIEKHLARYFPDTSFALRTQTFAGGRKVLAEILDTPEDLSGRDARNDCIVAVQDQMERFGFINSNLYQDFYNRSFFCEARVGQAYWSALASRGAMANPVEKLVSLAAFKKQVRPGDHLKIIGPDGRRGLGQTRTVAKVRSKDIVFEGPIYLALPRAAQFACDGNQVRIALGDEYDPDAHILYEWIRRAA